MIDLSGRTCIVTGGSRGVGRGIARGLLEAGANVHISARTATEGTHPLDRPGSLETMLADAAGLPGRLYAHRVDHAHDQETENFILGVIEAEGRLDLLVNNAWPGYERMEEAVEPGRNPFTWVDPIWDQPMWRFEAMIGVGLRSAWCATRMAAGHMARRRSGLIVNISYWAAQKFIGNPIYGVAKAAADKLARDVAHAMREHNVAAVSLYPGLVRTEMVMLNAQYFDMSNSESPEFIGRAVAHLAADPRVMEKSGSVLVAAQLALEYGFTDIDGRQPRPLTLETA
jgi:dehydrogenase/reductase SDR family member 1